MVNEYDAEDEKNLEEIEGPGLRWMSIVVVCLVVVGFFSLAWYAYHTSQQPLASEDAETITADDTPYKEKPSQPGGMEIEHQDATVYDMIADPSKKEAPKVEQLLPEAEEPMVTRDATAVPPKKDVDDYMKQEPAAEPSAEAEQEKTEEPSPPVNVAEPKGEEVVKVSPAAGTAEPPAEAPKEVVVNKPLSKVGAEKAKPAAAPKSIQVASAPKKEAVKPATPKPSGGSFQVQVGALKSQAEAEAAWKSLAAKHGALLNGKSHAIVKADLGEKGTFYRLRVTGLASKNDASKLCSGLQGRGASCMPVN